MTFIPAGHVQWATFWKPSNHRHQSPFPNPGNVQWHSGAEKHQFGSLQDSLDPRSTIHALCTTAELAQICRPAGAVLSHADGFCVLGAPPSTTVPHCFCWVHKHWMFHRKQSPKRPWQKFYGGVQQTSMSSLVSSLDTKPLPVILPSLGSTTLTVSHTLAPSVGCYI